MASPGVAALRRPRRADAQRNFERLLSEARGAFAADGVGASLEDIARRAEVGIGTLYRHFPSREALLGAVICDSAEVLTRRVAELECQLSLKDALAAWAWEVVSYVATYRGLAASLCSSRSEYSQLHASCTGFQGAGAQLLSRAQAAGVVREDVSSADLFALIAAVAWTVEQDAEQGERLFALMLRGLWQ